MVNGDGLPSREVSREVALYAPTRTFSSCEGFLPRTWICDYGFVATPTAPFLTLLSLPHNMPIGLGPYLKFLPF